MIATRIAFAAVIVFAGVAVASAQAPASPPAKTSAPTSSSSTSHDPSVATRVETWTKKQWNAAQAEWAKDKAKWADCRKQSKAQDLAGQKNLTFLYQCMTG